MKSIFPKSCKVKLGDRYGRLVVVGLPFKSRKNPNHCQVFCVCRCDCGKVKCVIADNLWKTTRSCGDHRAETSGRITHGKSQSKGLYTVWAGMKARCFRPTEPAFKNYGGRGITICDEWRDFQAFHDWAMANGYASGLEIDRIENDGNYDPGNCRFVTRKVNIRNTRANRILTAFGESKTVADWAEDGRCSVGYFAIIGRLKLGWSHESAISLPLFYRKARA